MSDVVIYHNPRCSKSREALALIQQAGIEPTVVEYLKTGWNAVQLRDLADRAGGVRALLRRAEPAAKGLSEVSDEAILAAMIADPVLVERPIVATPRGVAVCRPPERVLDLL